MIKFRISILLGFNLLVKLENEKGGKGNKQKKEKPDKKSKKDKNAKKIEEVEVEVVKPRYLIEVGAAVGFAHIEYQLIPERPKYQIDVVCWGPIAKVFSVDGDVTLKTFVKNEIAWVPVCIRHVLNHLDETCLHTLREHIVDYTIYTNKNKLGTRAKSENTNTFFIREEDLDSPQKFTKAYSADPNLEKCEDEKDKRMKELNEEIKKILWECADTPGMNYYEEIVTILEFPSDPLHNFQINKIIDRVTNGKKVECKDFAPPCPLPEGDEVVVVQEEKIQKKEKGKKKAAKSEASPQDKPAKKNKKADSKKEKTESDVVKINIPAEVFYTDPKISIYDMKTTSTNVTHVFILTTVKRLLSKLQKYSLNPLIIKIKKLSNLPVDELSNQRFKRVYAYYNVPYIARCSTIEKPLERTIKFNEAHAHFTSIVPKIKLLEFMQTQRLFVEIRGIRDEIAAPPAATLFGEEKEDSKISSKLTTRQCVEKLKTNKEPSCVTLAVACYDLSSLVTPVWDFLEKAPCHHPDCLLFQKTNIMHGNIKLVDAVTVNEINLGLELLPKSTTPLSESLLSSLNTTLKVEVYLSAPHNAFLEVHTFPDIFRRLFVVVNYEELAMTLLNEIMLHNQQVLGPQTTLVNYIKCKANTSETVDNPETTEYAQLAHMEALTGFVVDNGKSYAFFLEGIANGFIREIWDQIMTAHQAVLKRFYHGDFCFEKRLYTEFLKFGGFYTINLKMPLQQILNQGGIYLEGNVPIPCWQALKKLNLLFKCASQRAMNQYCLFPTPRQLMSLDFEYGVPFRWKTVEPSAVKKPIENQVEKSETTSAPLPSKPDSRIVFKTDTDLNLSGM